MIKKKYIIILSISLLIFSIISIFIVRDFRRVKKDIEILDRLILIVEVSSNTGLLPVHEKVAYLELLDFYENELDHYLGEISSDDIRNKILKTKDVIHEQENRIKRLNDFIHDSIEIKESLEIMWEYYQKPAIIKDSSILQFTFICPEDEDSNNVIAIKSNVYVDDSLVYSQQYKPENINSIIVPYSPGSNERVEIGYITKDNKFKYAVY